MEDQYPINRQLLLRDRETGELKPLFAGVGLPFALDDGRDFCCKVYISQGILKPTMIYGIDALQATSLAIGTIDKLLQRAQDNGDLFWSSGEPY
ncbi:MAG: hypothetical protein JO142_11375 [Burkholderiales bacterium]|nr:hypothetical protein [Burkholderiales bacterium]